MGNFKPDYTPIEMIKLGIFGGAYFNEPKITYKTGYQWNHFVPQQFLRDLLSVNGRNKTVTSLFDKEFNMYKVTCGSDYDSWLGAGWICDLDPYGWFNWYINYYYGRKCFDDDRQIQRWSQFKSRHSGLLKRFPNSNKTKQNLLHWGIDYNKIIL
tara:strand:+ start:70143 stop:70607 length:465 start_codon:yes stop_codon:yes gene_type:complete